MSAIKHNVADLIWKSPGSDIEVLSLEVEQRLSELYLVTVEIKSGNPALAFTDMLHAEAKLVLKCGPTLTDERPFSGIITRFSQGRTRHGNLANASKKSFFYRVEIRPKLWLLTQRHRSKVFQKLTAKDIVDQVLGDHGIQKSWQLQGSPAQREYCVQYEESDYRFISRLLEDEGITFFFDQDANKVVFSDHAGGHPDCKPVADARYVEEVSPRFQLGKQEFISDFTYEESVATGLHVLNHYNYETSQTSLLVDDTDGQVPCYADLERYEHSQNYVDGGEGAAYVKLRKQEAGASARSGRGITSCRSFEAGNTFTLKDHFRGALNTKWLLTACFISAEQGRYQCRFSALPAEIPFRPPRRTPKPRVFGLQTAVVTGPPGSKVYLDSLGRCKLQFHWDREGEKNDRSSMWVRVSNNYAGKDYGVQFIPRIGHEVIVTFIDGDPDLPIVTGRVYNDFNTPPLGPGEKWQNIIKSIKDNHLMFDDMDGNELVDIRAEKDMNTLVIHDDRQRVGNDRTINIGHDLGVTVGHDRGVTIARDHGESIGRHKTVTVGSNLTETVGGNHTENVSKSLSLTVSKDMSTSVGDDQSINVGQNQSLSIGKDLLVSIGKDMSFQISKKVNLKAGNEITINGGKSATISIADKLTVDIGSASMVLKKNGDIEIKGKKINVKGSAPVTIKGSKISLN